MWATTSFMLVFAGSRRRRYGPGAARRCGRQTANTSFRRWRIRMTAMPSDFSWRIRSSTLSHLAHGERRGRLVHDDELGVEGQRARDRDRLLLAAGEAGRPSGGSTADAGAEPVDHRLRPRRVHRGLVDDARNQPEHGSGRLAAEEDVGGDVLLLGERQVLVDHLDAEPAALRRDRVPDVAAVEADRRRRRRGRCR